MRSTASVVTGLLIKFMKLQSVVFVVATLIGLASSASAQSKRQIHLEVSSGRLAALETQQKWMEILSQVGADRVRSSTARSSGKVSVDEQETSLGVVVKVRGVIIGKKLELPGGTFTQRDSARIREYLEALRLDGVETALADKKAFGLTSEQLVELSDALSKPLQLKTKGSESLEIVKHIQSKVRYSVELDRVARAAITASGSYDDELDGLSMGTALAATLRPAGLVLQPLRQQGRELQLRIVDSRRAEEFWPIGWPSQVLPVEAAPTLFQKNQLEIRQFPLDQVLAAIEIKAKLPMLLDYKSMASREIDLAKTNVTFVKKNASYGYSLRKLLSQTKPAMKYEIRNDDAGKPFLWLTTTARVR